MKDETCYQDQSEPCQKKLPYIHIKKLIFQNLALEVGILMFQAYGMIVQKKSWTDSRGSRDSPASFLVDDSV